MLYFRQPEATHWQKHAIEAMEFLAPAVQDLYVYYSGDLTRNVELVADSVRQSLGITRGPICDPVATIENLGIPVLYGSRYPTNSAISATKGALILQSDGATPLDLVEELVFLLLFGRQYKHGISMQEESIARKIAGAIMLPKAEIQRELMRARPLGEPYAEVLLYLSRRYNLSPGQVLYRMIAAGMLLPIAQDIVDWDELRAKAKEIDGKLRSRVLALRRIADA